MRRMREDRRGLGSSANLSEMWRYTLLRQFAKPARQQTRACYWTSGHRFRTTGRALVVLLSGRCVRGILGSGGSCIDRLD